MPEQSKKCINLKCTQPRVFISATMLIGATELTIFAGCAKEQDALLQWSLQVCFSCLMNAKGINLPSVFAEVLEMPQCFTKNVVRKVILVDS